MSHVNKFNSEGYADPTAYQAITLAELEGIVLPGDAPAIATEEEQRKPFSIADDDCADWAVRKIAADTPFARPEPRFGGVL